MPSSLLPSTSELQQSLKLSLYRLCGPMFLRQAKCGPLQQLDNVYARRSLLLAWRLEWLYHRRRCPVGVSIVEFLAELRNASWSVRCWRQIHKSWGSLCLWKESTKVQIRVCIKPWIKILGIWMIVCKGRDVVYVPSSSSVGLKMEISGLWYCAGAFILAVSIIALC